MMFGQPFGICTKNIMASGNRTSRSGRSLTKRASNLMKNTGENQNKSLRNRYCWRFARNWKKGARMKKIRAEPGKHRLDNGFMKWSQETIEANKKTGHGITDKKETCPNTPTH